MMDKLRKLFKKYKKLLLVLILVLAIILVILVLVFNKKRNEDGYSNTVVNIENPYPVQKKPLVIDLQGNTTTIPKKDKVLKVQGFNTEVLNFFVNTYSDKEIDYSEDISVMFNKKGFLSFTNFTGVFSIKLEDGLSELPLIDSEDNLRIFFQEYFDVDNIAISNESKSQFGVEFKGKYVLKDIEIGSSYLNGEAFIINVNMNDEITGLTVLLIKEENLKEYQYMPLIDINDVVSNNFYPKMIGESKIEERFYEKPVPYEIEEYFVEKMDLIYVFNDSNSSYVLPTYKFKGNGRIVTVLKEKYWAETDLFICAIDPSYLNMQEIVEIESKEEEGPHFSPPSLN